MSIWTLPPLEYCIKDFAGVAKSPAYDLIYFTDDARI